MPSGAGNPAPPLVDLRAMPLKPMTASEALACSPPPMRARNFPHGLLIPTKAPRQADGNFPGQPRKQAYPKRRRKTPNRQLRGADIPARTEFHSGVAATAARARRSSNP